MTDLIRDSHLGVTREGPARTELRIIGVELTVEHNELGNQALEMFACSHTIPLQRDDHGNVRDPFRGGGVILNGSYYGNVQRYSRPMAVITLHTSDGDRQVRVQL